MKTISKFLISHKHKILMGFVGLFVFLGLLLINNYIANIATAGYEQNDTEGYFKVDFLEDQLGLSQSLGDIVFDTTWGSVTISGAQNVASGCIRTSPITPVSFQSWGDLELTIGTLVDNNDVKIDILECSSGNIIENYSGLNLIGNKVDISGIDVSTYPCVYGKVSFFKNEDIAPVINELKVTWTPLSQYLNILQAPVSVEAGQNFLISMQYSLSYVDDDGVIAYIELPKKINNNITGYTPDYNQAIDLTFISAEQQGIYTSNELILGSIIIPANSVYRDLGNLEAGNNGTLKFTAKIPIFTESGIVYSLNSFIKGENSELIESNIIEITNISNPNPSLVASVDTFVLNGENVFFPTIYIPGVVYTINMNNYYPASEAIFEPRLRADLSDVFDKLQGVECGSLLLSELSDRVLDISESGNLNILTEEIIRTGLIEDSSKEYSYQIDYSGCTVHDTLISTNYYFSGKNTIEKMDDIIVKISTEFTPELELSKIGNYNSIYDDNIVSFDIKLANISLPRVENVVIFDKFAEGLDLVSSIPGVTSNVDFMIYYHTGFSGNTYINPPAYTYATALSGDFGTGWTEIFPTTRTTRAGIFVQCINSEYLQATGSCLDKASEILLTLQTRGSLVDACTPENKINQVYALVYSGSDSPENDDDAMTGIVPTYNLTAGDTVTVNPKIGLWENTKIIGPTTITVGDQVSYSISNKNIGGGIISNGEIIYYIPTVEINGVEEYLDVTATAVGGSINYDLINGEITISYGDIAINQSIAATITLDVPAGIELGKSYNMLAKTLGSDQNCGNNLVSTANFSFSFDGTPNLKVIQDKDLEYILSNGEITYRINELNNGEVITKNAYVISQIPSEGYFVEAYITGQDSNGFTYDCIDCTVLFADNTALLPVNLSVVDPFVIADMALFVEGTYDSGSWKSPYGSGTKYIAYKLDNNLGLFPQGASTIVGYKIQDNNSEQGDVIINNSAIFSDDVLQSIGNSVQTTIHALPGISISLSSDPITLPAGEYLNLDIAYYNNSDGTDLRFDLEIELPDNVSLSGISNLWNYTTQLNGGTGVVQDILNNEVISIGDNPNGSGVIVYFDAARLRIDELGGDGIYKLEGGLLTLLLKVEENIASQTEIELNLKGIARNMITETIRYDLETITISNPDLYISKEVDIQEPIQGETLLYTIDLSNEGGYQAIDIYIEDTLEIGLCYILGSTMSLDAERIILEPTVIGVCGDEQILIWTGIKHNDYATGYFDTAASTRFVYNVEILSSVSNGVELTNAVETFTSLEEDLNYSNTASARVYIPDADPYVNMNVASMVSPGDPFSYTIKYGNNTRPTATGVYLIHKLPDYNTGKDIKLVDIVTSLSEEVYYHTDSNEVAFDFNNPTNLGRTTTKPIAPNYIAFKIGDLGSLVGPNTITINVEAKDPQTLEVLPPGTALVFQTDVYSTTADEFTGNNVSYGITRAPGLDLSISISANHEGSYPGIKPGTELIYDITFENIGSKLSCANYLDITLNNYLELDGDYHNFEKLELVTKNNVATYPVGKDESFITSDVEIFVDETNAPLYRFYLGPNTTDYQEICIPGHSRQTFQINGLVDIDTPTDTKISITAQIIEDRDVGIEYITGNNYADNFVFLYLADVLVDIATNPIDITTAIAGESIDFKISYDNIGLTAAESVFIQTNIPEGTCFAGITLPINIGLDLQYSLDGITRDYNPLGGVDCDVVSTKIVREDDMDAVGTTVGEDTNTNFLGTINGLRNLDGLELAVDSSVYTNVVEQPLKGGYTTIYDVFVGDIDTDNNKEIVTMAMSAIRDNIDIDIWDVLSPGIQEYSIRHLYHWSFGDVDHDGKDDLFLWGPRGWSIVGLTGGNVTYKMDGVDILDRITSSTIQDIDNDGYNEIVLGGDRDGGAKQGFRIYRVTDNTLQHLYDRELGESYDLFTIGDINNDGINELYIPQGLDGVSVYDIDDISLVYDRDVTLPSVFGVVSYSYRIQDILIEDLNNSNEKELVVATERTTYWFGNVQSRAAMVYIYNEQDTFLQSVAPLQYVGITTRDINLLTADANQNDKKELIIRTTATPSKFLMYEFDQDWNSIEIYTDQNRNYINAIAVSDIDGDAEIDVLVGGRVPEGICIGLGCIPPPEYVGVKNYEFQESIVTEKYSNTTNWVNKIATYDFNDDGVDTIIAVDDRGTDIGIRLYDVDENGIINITAQATGLNNLQELEAGLINQGGLHYVVGGGSRVDGVTNYGFKIYESNGSSLQEVLSYTGDWSSKLTALALINMDDDDALEILAGATNAIWGSKGVEVYDFTGGNIELKYALSGWNNLTTISSLGDINNDGHTEFVVGGGEALGALKIYNFSGGLANELHNFSDFTFVKTSVVGDSLSSNSKYIAVAGAGRDAGSTRGTKIFEIDESLNVTEIFSKGTSSDRAYHIERGDINQNGKSDIVVVGTFYNTSDVLIGDGFEVYELSGSIVTMIGADYTRDSDSAKTLAIGKIDDYLGDSLIVGGYHTDGDSLRVYQNTSTSLLESGSYLASIGTIGSLSLRNNLYLDQNIEDATDIFYTIYGTTAGLCDTNNILQNIGSTSDEIIDISNISNTNTEICLGVELIGNTVNTPTLKSWYINYISDYVASFDFSLRIQDGGYLGPVFELISEISTITPQTNYANDRSVYSLPLLSADLSVVKTVDKAAVLSGDLVTYSIEYYNRGPYPAENVVIEDTPDATITNVGQTSRSLGTVAVGERVTLIVTGIISSSVSQGDILTNGVVISSDTYDPIYSNNISSIQSVVGGYANVFTEIDCVESVYINDEFICEMNYFNNGNITASGVILTGVFDADVSLVSYTGDSCITLTGTRPHQLVCDALDLAVGSGGNISVTLLVDNDISLLINKEILELTIRVSTTSSETNIGDNFAEDLVPVRQQNSSIIQGTVFIDENKNDQYELELDSLFEGARVFIGGSELITNDILLPDKALYSLAYDALRQEMGLTEPFSYTKIDPVVSQDNGEYFLVGLNPGTFNLYIEGTNGYVEDYSVAGIVNSDVSGEGSLDNILVDGARIVSIVIPSLPDGSFAEEFLFTLQGDCGDGLIQVGEFCDDGLLNGTPGMCDYACTSVMSLCGNNIIENGEQCDDGNLVNGDGCNIICRTESSGGGGGGASRDVCPEDRDCSSSYYDNLCGSCEEAEDHGSAGNCSIAGSIWSNEIDDSYQFACDEGITTIDNIVSANPDGELIRMEMAKMVTIFMVKVLGVTTYHDDPRCKDYNDMEGVDDEMRFYMEMACGLGAMGMESNGVIPLDSFMPYNTVDRAQFGTVFSRIMFDGKYNVRNPELNACRYCDHLTALKDNQIMTKINEPYMEEIRAFVRIMMERVSGRQYGGREPEYRYLGNR